jgi:hypothetical protein
MNPSTSASGLRLGFNENLKNPLAIKIYFKLQHNDGYEPGCMPSDTHLSLHSI